MGFCLLCRLDLRTKGVCELKGIDHFRSRATASLARSVRIVRKAVAHAARLGAWSGDIVRLLNVPRRWSVPRRERRVSKSRGFVQISGSLSWWRHLVASSSVKGAVFFFFCGGHSVKVRSG